MELWLSICILNLQLCFRLIKTLITNRECLQIVPIGGSQMFAAVIVDVVPCWVIILIPRSIACSFFQLAAAKYLQPSAPILFPSKSQSYYKDS